MKGRCNAPKTKEWAAASMRISTAYKKRSADCKNNVAVSEIRR